MFASYGELYRQIRWLRRKRGMATDKVRFGVIGTGGMGSAHCGILPQVPEAQLTAICDIDPTTRETVSAKYGVPGFATHRELLDSGLVDAVIIATPHYFHPPIAIDAFARGIHVLSEKPISVTVSAADAMIKAAKESGKKFAVMYQMRTEPQNIAARRIIESGQLGAIYRTSLVMAWYRSQAYYDSGGWRATWSGEGGGVLINQAPHMLDLFTWFAGLPARVSAQTRSRLHEIEVEDEAFALLEYPNGAHGYLYATTNEAPGQDRIEIVGEAGKIVVHSGAVSYWRLQSPIGRFTKESTEMWSAPQAIATDLELIDREEGHAAITRNFCRAILSGEPLLAPGEEGINAVEMIDSIILSGKTGQPADIPVDRKAYDALLDDLRKSSK